MNIHLSFVVEGCKLNFNRFFALLSLYNIKGNIELDPVGSTVRYEMMKLCIGSVKDTMRR